MRLTDLHVEVMLHEARKPGESSLRAVRLTLYRHGYIDAEGVTERGHAAIARWRSQGWGAAEVAA